MLPMPRLWASAPEASGLESPPLGQLLLSDLKGPTPLSSPASVDFVSECLTRNIGFLLRRCGCLGNRSRQLRRCGPARLILQRAPDDLQPGVRSTTPHGLALNARKAMQKQLAYVGENSGVAHGNQILGQQGKEFSQGMIDRRGGLEVLERAEEFGGESFGIHASSVKLLLALPVIEAER